MSKAWQGGVKWIATGSMIGGAILVSVSVTFATTILPFVLFLLGHVLWSMFAVFMKERQLFWLNASFIPLDLYAMYVRL